MTLNRKRQHGGKKRKKERKELTENEEKNYLIATYTEEIQILEFGKNNFKITEINMHEY